MNVLGAPGIGMVLPGIRTGFDGQEAVTPVGFGDRPTASGEVWIQRRVVLVQLMVIPAGGVGLPDFNQSMGYRTGEFIEHPSGDNDPLADRLAFMLACEIKIRRLDVVPAED